MADQHCKASSLPLPPTVILILILILILTAFPIE
jgi:hypothetical protein